MSNGSKFGDALKDPSAAAARGKWLARGAWLLAAAEVVVAVRNHVTDRLTTKERKRMLEIVRSSKGRPSNLSDRERKELRALLGKVEPASSPRRSRPARSRAASGAPVNGLRLAFSCGAPSQQTDGRPSRSGRPGCRAVLLTRKR